MTTYTVHIIADENCDSIRPEAILSTSSLDEATTAAANASAPYGAAVRRDDGQIDFGFGFGQPVPDLG